MPAGIAISDNRLYWGNTGSSSIGSADLDGANFDASWIDNIAEPTGVTSYGDFIYWTSNVRVGAIGRANLDRSEIERQFMKQIGYPGGIAVDAGSDPVIPSSRFRVGAVNHNKRAGTAKVKLILPGPGSLIVRSQGRLAVRRNVKAAGMSQVTIGPTGETRSRLNKKGHARIKATFEFTARGGKPFSIVRNITLIKRSRNRSPARPRCPGRACPTPGLG